jgi:hypothetical protein
LEARTINAKIAVIGAQSVFVCEEERLWKVW